MVIIDNAYEPEARLQQKLLDIKKAVAKGTPVTVVHPFGHIHKRLENIPGVVYKPSAQLPRRPGTSALDKWAVPASGRFILPKCGGIVHIHWMYLDRHEERLSAMEQFHLNMLWAYGVDYRFDEVTIHIATSDGLPRELARKEASRFGSVKFVRNSPEKWEADTFKALVEKGLKSDKNCYYCHFKGVTHCADGNVILKARNPAKWKNDIAADIAYWCFVMYGAIFAPRNVKLLGKFAALGGIMHKDPKFTSWSNSVFSTPGVHNSGSFQAWTSDGVRKYYDAKESHFHNPYDVERFVTAVFPPETIHWEVGESQNPGDMYSLLTHGKFPGIARKFHNGRISPTKENPVVFGNWSLKGIGGTETYTYALASEFARRGIPTMYYTPDDGDTGRRLRELGIMPWDGRRPCCTFVNQGTGVLFKGLCPTIQTVHGTLGVEAPREGMWDYAAISDEVSVIRKVHNVIWNGVDLERFCSKKPLHETAATVLSLCQGNDAILKLACQELGLKYIHPVGRVWNVEDYINDADIVVGLGRSLYDSMACGRVCISYDNREYGKVPNAGIGYLNASNIMDAMKTNLISRDGIPHNTAWMVDQLRKYNAADGLYMRKFAEDYLDIVKVADKYIEMLF